jgi:hypothetical protein
MEPFPFRGINSHEGSSDVRSTPPGELPRNSRGPLTRRKHFSMIREFHLADFFTLANGACGIGGVSAR